MPQLHSIDFETIRRYSKALSLEVSSWSEHPWSLQEMEAQYRRIHTTPNQRQNEG